MRGVDSGVPFHPIARADIEAVPAHLTAVPLAVVNDGADVVDYAEDHEPTPDVLASRASMIALSASV